MASSMDNLKPARLRDPLLTHKVVIKDPDQGPILEKTRRTPESKRAAFRIVLKEMLEAGLIQPSTSPWSSPVLLVPKKDGSFRVTIDYRKLNSRTVKDAYPLPHQEDLFNRLSKAKWYSKLDLFSGYYQIGMDEESRKLTAFACEDGLYEYCVMPMGLTNSPATFQRAMNTILQEGIRRGFVLVYLDDILVFSNTLEEHEEHMRWLVEQLKANELKVKISKCEVVLDGVQFLGHEITQGHIRPLSDKIEVIDKCPRPKTIKELQHFLGLARVPVSRSGLETSRLETPFRDQTRRLEIWSRDRASSRDKISRRLETKRDNFAKILLFDI